MTLLLEQCTLYGIHRATRVVHGAGDLANSITASAIWLTTGGILEKNQITLSHFRGRGRNGLVSLHDTAEYPLLPVISCFPKP